MPTTYDFETQLKVGQRAENAIAALLHDRYFLCRAGAELQNRGIDWVCRSRLTGKQLTIEIKADLKAHRFGNGFIEIPSNESRGWSASCTADLLLYFCPGLGQIYFFRPQDLRFFADSWRHLYPVKAAQNDGYKTWGVCVPLRVLRGVAIAIATVKVRGFHN